MFKALPLMTCAFSLLAHLSYAMAQSDSTPSLFETKLFKEEDNASALFADDQQSPEEQLLAHQKVDTEKARQVLSMFEGSWKGSMALKTMAGKELNEFNVQQDYWWDADKERIIGLAVFDEAGILRYAGSELFIEDHVLYSDIEENGKKKRYKGLLEGNGIIWIPQNHAKSLDHQVKVQFKQTDDGLIMENKGYERYVRGKIRAWILLSGNLKQISKQVDAPLVKSKEKQIDTFTKTPPAAVAEKKAQTPPSPQPKETLKTKTAQRTYAKPKPKQPDPVKQPAKKQKRKRRDFWEDDFDTSDPLL